MSKPRQRKGEGDLAYHHRLILWHEWQTLMRTIESQVIVGGKIKVQAPVRYVKRGVNHGQT